MSQNYRKSIESLNKFLQFTTMNVIDGQAVQIKNFSLTFYSLTIDNILNINIKPAGEINVSEEEAMSIEQDFDTLEIFLKWLKS